jgi:hypothetical protein
MPENIVFEFLGEYRHPGFFLYAVKLTNTGNKTAEYDMRNLHTSQAINVLDRYPDYKIEGIPLLNTGKLKKDESIEGLVCFKPSALVATTSPILFWHGLRHRAKGLKKEHKDKLKEKYKKGGI